MRLRRRPDIVVQSTVLLRRAERHIPRRHRTRARHGRHASASGEATWRSRRLPLLSYFLRVNVGERLLQRQQHGSCVRSAFAVRGPGDVGRAWIPRDGAPAAAGLPAAGLPPAGLPPGVRRSAGRVLRTYREASDHSLRSRSRRTVASSLDTMASRKLSRCMFSARSRVAAAVPGRASWPAWVVCSPVAVWRNFACSK